MELASFTFIFFAIITIFIYFIVPKKIQWIVLLASSILFLFWDGLNIKNIIYVLIILLSSYFTAILVDKYKDTKKAKVILLIGIFAILLELIVLKYTNLFIVSINYILNACGIQEFKIVNFNAPIGLSYYSLIMIGYILDVYRELVKPEKNIFKCALFMSYFPILPSGPFIRYENMKEQLYAGHKFSLQNFVNGSLRIIWGFFKVLVISQRLAMFVNPVFEDYYVLDGFYIIIAMLFFTLQLYTNFSGSIDIIIGLSEILGIKLPENFKTPFFSKTITEFWRNWHITLGAWLKDYIFYPLLKSNDMQALGKSLKKHFSKNVAKKVPLYLSMFVMWILIGVWHGGAYNYILASGILQFIFILFEDLLEKLAKKVYNFLRINTESYLFKVYQAIRTFLLFSFAMLFFRAPNIATGIDMIKYSFNLNPEILFNKSLFIIGLDRYDFVVLVIAIVTLIIVELISKRCNVREKLLKQNIVIRWTIIYILIFSVIIFGCYGPGYDATEFIYRQF